MSDFARSELDRVMNGNTIRAPRAEFEAGEWDHFRTMNRRTIRRLIGGGFLTSGGLLPDQAAEYIVEHVSGVDSVCSALNWYVRTALVALDESAAERWRRQYATRSQRAVEAGFPSYWYQRLYRAEMSTP